MAGSRGEAFKDALKKVLKTKGRTYQELADHLEVSLPTVKRWLGPEEISLGRLLQILAWLEIGLGELESLSEIEQRREVGVLSIEQEKFFVQNPAYLAYLVALHDGESPEVIAAKHGLTKSSTELYLSRLERLEFLTRDLKGRVRLLHREIPNHNPKGPLLRAQYKQYIEASGDFFKRQVSKMIENQDKGVERDRHRGWMSIRAMKISRAAYLEWHARAIELVKEIDRRSELEKKLEPATDAVNVVVSFFDSSLDLEDPDIEIIAASLGRVVNLESRPGQSRPKGSV